MNWAFGSVDTLTVGGLQIPKMPFSEVDYLKDTPTDRLVSLFGLAAKNPFPRFVKSAARKPISPGGFPPSDLPSPFKSMIDQSVLENNIFSLKFPQSEQDDGYLMFGGYEKSYFEGEMVPHPLFPPGTKYWSVEASSITLRTTGVSGKSHVLINESLFGYQAILNTRSSDLAFPEPLFSRIADAINMTKGMCNLRVVDCDTIDNLPKITIRLGDQMIELTGREYVERVPGRPWCSSPDLECVPAITERRLPNPLRQPVPPIPADKEDYIVLGAKFLERVYSVFDYDHRTVSCKSFP
jgi:hypothetical protein